MSINKEISFSPSVTIDNFLPRNRNDVHPDEILAGLTGDKKYISSIFFYDETGSRLFEAITQLPEYYLYHTELELLSEVAPLVCSSKQCVDIVEIGSGDCSKISILLEAIPPAGRKTVRYIPVDISPSALEKSSRMLNSRFPGVEFHGVAANFIDQLNFIPEGNRRFFCFLGSTLGNLSSQQSLRFLRRIRENMHPGNELLMGLDMVKDTGVLERAYNDSAGVTAEFNLNILKVVNRHAGTNFDPDDFLHVAFYNPAHSRIEMHLKANRDVEVESPHLEERIVVRRGEMIHTENSHKFTRKQIHRLAERAGLTIREIFTDRREWFSLVYLVRKL